MRILHSVPPYVQHYEEIHFYDPHGKLLNVVKNPVDVDMMLLMLLNMTDDHNLVHIEAVGNIIEVCATISKE